MSKQRRPDLPPLPESAMDLTRELRRRIIARLRGPMSARPTPPQLAMSCGVGILKGNQWPAFQDALRELRGEGRVNVEMTNVGCGFLVPLISLQQRNSA